jgi:hypothetical protein
VSIDHQKIIETLAKIYQLINSGSIELSNLSKTSYFEFNFLSLNNMLKDQFANLVYNEFFARNFTRILEILSNVENIISPQLFNDRPSLLNINTFIDTTLEFKDILNNMEKELLLNLKLAQN